ncbi:VOC family protein [Pseudarthrobacter sp. PH31-O2]|uniref:VOC family protein n=1 Tax=Pseudarthrobacter sp. PH31-O2 TaxID=3046206 RepID=UPI0024B926F9|nr:VOC family protein [Pseudarthrobacter sp. PH31-O2]MDJ0354501.1 VOC family protein [Pseudarthrobacter sp. PH31-O2]
MSLRGFSTINFWAEDVAGATAWYAQFLGLDPYFERSGPDGEPVYAEFRIGDYQHELGIIDLRYRPSPATTGQASIEPGGAVTHWHVDDLDGTVEMLLAMGATVYQPITTRGDTGFVTASVIDPFGNVLGVMTSPHYLEVLSSSLGAKP